MAFNGTGTHNRVHDWTTDLQNTVPVTASRMDAEHDDISTALSLTICRDGQSTTTARIPFAAGVSAAAGSTASVSYSAANDTNTGLYFPSTDQWGLVAGGTATLASTSTALTASVNVTPSSSDGAALGTSSVMWSDLFLASGAVINFNNGDITVTHSADTLTVAGGTFAASGNVTVGGTLGVTGAGTFSSTLAVTGNATVGGSLETTGDLRVNTNKVVMLAASGNTSIAGTLDVTGASTFSGGGKIPLYHIRDEQTSGTAGQTLTDATWNTVRLNTEATDDITVTLSSNQFTLPAGTYEIDAIVPVAWDTTGATTQTISVAAQLRLRNTTAGSTILNGITAYIRDCNSQNIEGGGGAIPATLRGRFTVAGSQALEVQIYTDGTSAGTMTQGKALSQGTEVYGDVLIKRIS